MFLILFFLGVHSTVFFYFSFLRFLSSPDKFLLSLSFFLLFALLLFLFSYSCLSLMSLISAFYFFFLCYPLYFPTSVFLLRFSFVFLLLFVSCSIASLFLSSDILCYLFSRFLFLTFLRFFSTSVSFDIFLFLSCYLFAL